MSYWCIFADSSKNGTINIPYPMDPRQPDWRQYSNETYDEYQAAMDQFICELANELVDSPLVEWHTIPYPAAPQINQQGTPSFCFRGSQCWGKSSCPGRSCVD